MPVYMSQEILLSVVAKQFKVAPVDVIKCLLNTPPHMRERFQGPEQKYLGIQCIQTLSQFCRCNYRRQRFWIQ